MYDLGIKLAQEESEDQGRLHQTESPYHKQRPGIPPARHLKSEPKSEQFHVTPVRDIST